MATNSHDTIGIIDAARKENILLLCLPPHTWHFLCPLDRTVFGWLSKEYNKQCSSFVSANPVNTVDKTKSLPKLFTSAFDQSVNPANIISGFRSCGILPFNPLAIPSEAFTPSMTFENQPTESSNHPMSWVTDKLNDLSTKMNCTLHDEPTENGTDISEIVTENEATPDIQNIDPLLCGENQVTDESCVLQEILINTPANTDTPLDLPFFVEEVTGLLTRNYLLVLLTGTLLFQICSKYHHLRQRKKPQRLQVIAF